MKSIIRFEYGEPIELPFSLQEEQRFKEYLQKMWQNRRFLDEYAAENHSKTPFFHWEQGAFFPRNYVGFVKFGDWVIEVYPKIFAQNPPSRGEMLRHLFFYLHYAEPQQYAWQAQKGGGEALPNAWEFYQKMMLRQIKTYLSQHLYQSYETKTQALPFLRGRLAVMPYLKNSLSNGKWQDTVSTHQSLQSDNAVNQLLKFTLKQWQTQNTDQAINELLLELIFALKEVKDRHFTLREAQTIPVSIFAREARQVLDICLYFLENEVASLGNISSQNFVWLVPMERVYEKFIIGFLQTHFPSAEAKWQNPSYLAKTKIGEKPVFRIQPDIYLPHQERIIDAKYKLRNTSLGQAQGGVASEDMYQMLSYGLAKQCQEITLLYPTAYGTEPFLSEDFEVKGGFLEDKSISVRAVDLDITQKASSEWKVNLEQLLITQFEKIIF